VLASQLPHQQVVLVTPRLAAHAFLPFDLLKGTLNERPPGLSSIAGRGMDDAAHQQSCRAAN
jgi:hypothetical protein